MYNNYIHILTVFPGVKLYIHIPHTSSVMSKITTQPFQNF